jgi:hypothetical protein
MKKTIILCVLAGTMFWLCQCLVKNNRNKLQTNQQELSYCFILGEDKGEQQYYTLAEEYFNTNSVKACQKIIKHIRSLEELNHFLNRQTLLRPIDRMEIVVHGNVWSGLSVSIHDGGERAYPKELLKATRDGQLPLLNDNVVDSNTIINVWGCGIGTNPLLQLGVRNCFQTQSGQQPKINLTKKFVVFKRSSDKVNMVQASYWPYFFKRGYRPSEKTIADELAKQYPDVSIPEVLHEENDNHRIEEFNVPIKWKVRYALKEDRPDLSTTDSQMAWIKSQPKLMRKIKDLSIPIDQYNWVVQKVLEYKDDGSVVPFVQAIGMSSVLCVLDMRQ